MRITYDPSVDAAYLYLAHIPDGGVEQTYVCDAQSLAGSVHLDIDKEGRLVGIEVLGASDVLPSELLRQADLLGPIEEVNAKR
jgi:uncharacterized protein YuzE